MSRLYVLLSSMDNSITTFGEAIEAIQTGLKTPVLVTSRRDGLLYPLLETVKAAAGLDKNAIPDETVLQREMPSHVQQLVVLRLNELGILN